jgi:hypothetical protein
LPQQGYNILKAYEKCYKMSYVCTLAHGLLWRYFGAKSKDFIEKSTNIGK